MKKIFFIAFSVIALLSSMTMMPSKEKKKSGSLFVNFMCANASREQTLRPSEVGKSLRPSVVVICDGDTMFSQKDCKSFIHLEKIPEGKAIVKASHPGFADIVDTFDIGAGEDVKEFMSFMECTDEKGNIVWRSLHTAEGEKKIGDYRPAQHGAFMYIITVPASVQPKSAMICGTDTFMAVGDSPVLMHVPYGKHQCIIEKEGYETIRQTVEINGPFNAEIFNLQPEKKK